MVGTFQAMMANTAIIFNRDFCVKNLSIFFYKTNTSFSLRNVLMAWYSLLSSDFGKYLFTACLFIPYSAIQIALIYETANLKRHISAAVWFSNIELLLSLSAVIEKRMLGGLGIEMECNESVLTLHQDRS